MKTLFAELLKCRRGATAIEYGLIASLLSAALIIGAQSLGGSINNTMGGTANFMENNRK